jgi:hypothetical protein
MRTQAATPAIPNAYISVSLNDEIIGGFQRALSESLALEGIECENSSAHAHVSIAYTEGECQMDLAERLAKKIASCSFEVNAGLFEVLEGQTTPYDYLVLSLDGASSALQNACSVVEGALRTRQFQGGFKSHVSLLKFKKGSITLERLEELVEEMNASQNAVLALGRRICLEGECVCVFDPNRQCRIEVKIRPAA